MPGGSLYDDVPYPGRPFAQTHPDRLATMATLFGLRPAAPGACRVLELGCGDGGNLLPMALALPGSRFVGLDLSARAVDRARSVARELGLDNVRFEALALEAYDPEPGSVDYVVAHGLYSWAPAPVRDGLLALCARALSAHGVAYVSYNARPGSHARQSLREMLAYALEGVEDPRERMAAGRALLADAGSVWRAGTGLETTLGGQAQMLLEQDDALFLHDTLSPVNEALYFHEFAAHAASHDLQFLAEAEFSEMQVEALPTALRERVLADGDVVRREQLLDFLRQRMFRQTLLCPAAAPVDRTPRAERVATLAAAAPIEAAADPAGGRVTFTGPGGGRLQTDEPLLVDALTRVGASWPGAVRVSELAGGPTAPPEDLAEVCEALLSCYAANLLGLHVHPAEPCLTPGPRPRASALARLQAREGEPLTTLWHMSIELEDELGRRLVTLLDGTRDRATLRAELRAGADPGQADVAGSLRALARAGLLVPEGGRSRRRAGRRPPAARRS